MTFNLDDLVITVDKDVPRTTRRAKGSRGINLDSDPRVIKLKAMEIGDSFFLEGVQRKDTRSVVNLGKKVSVFLDPRYFEVDEIAQVAGTRIWRVEESELKRRGVKVAEPAPTTKVEDPDDF